MRRVPRGSHPRPLPWPRRCHRAVTPQRGRAGLDHHPQTQTVGLGSRCPPALCPGGSGAPEPDLPAAGAIHPPAPGPWESHPDLRGRRGRSGHTGPRPLPWPLEDPGGLEGPRLGAGAARGGPVSWGEKMGFSASDTVKVATAAWEPPKTNQEFGEFGNPQD